MMSLTLTPGVAVSGKELTWIITSYFLGCFTAGYYWTRWRTGRDIRAEGSGSVGARNVGRLLGAPGFLITFLLDFAKGVLAVAGATYFKLGPESIVASVVAVVVGHNWPVQLRFRGGKGIASGLTMSGLVALALAPLGVFLCGLEKVGVAAVSFLAVLALLTHRRNIREEVARLVFHRSVEQAPVEMHKGPNDEA